ncbi:MAG TPA: DUF3455 domain-containing protein [Steroidobacteraceae bacterium]|jgi:hypothetical protein|nr:DUF3455 domain-containing protein [Steroidobacteraceae bacterium]
MNLSECCGRGAALAALLTCAATAHAQSRPQVPDTIQPSAGEHLVLVAHASGSQIYLCSAGADGKSQWTLKAPEAELRDDRGAVIGHHSAGPTWRHMDGSTVTAKATAKAASPDADSVPWLLLTAVSHDGTGVLSRVTSIQRIHTKGGQPPPADKCGAGQQSVETWIPYTADYYFYAPGS